MIPSSIGYYHVGSRVQSRFFHGSLGVRLWYPRLEHARDVALVSYFVICQVAQPVGYGAA